MLVDRVDSYVRRAIELKRDQQSFEDMGAFVAGLASWSWFATFTSRYSHLSRKAVRRFLAELETAARQKITFVVAWEYGEVGGHLHCHALISGVGHMDVSRWVRKANARFGHAHIELFDPKKGGAYYLVQNGSSDGGELEFGGGASTASPGRTK